MGQNFTNELEQHNDLQKRKAYSESTLANINLKAEAAFRDAPTPIAIFAAGSLGRLEIGRESDLDLFIVSDKEDSTRVNRLEEIRVFSKLIEINRELKLPEFSGDGRYLKIHNLTELINSTGDAHDDSENFFTTRLLLLLESKSIHNNKLREECIKKIVDNYFKDGNGKDFVPLFLLNDILRYWRTLCLNYERDRVRSENWWKKNLSLKFARKLTVFSTILLLLTDEVNSKESLISAIDYVPLKRLAMSFDKINDETMLAGFKDFLNNYEKFLAAKSHAELNNLEPSETIKNDFKIMAQSFGDMINIALMKTSDKSRLFKYLIA